MLSAISLCQIAAWVVAESPGSAAEGAAASMCILLDRAVDTVTPMCLQLTYEGLVDETLGITNGIVTLDPSGAVHAPAGLACMRSHCAPLHSWHECSWRP